jgi:hypothetical protein
MWIALSAAEGTVFVSATGAVALVALIAFGIWWFKPFRSRGDLRTIDPGRHYPDGDRERDGGDSGPGGVR